MNRMIIDDYDLKSISFIDDSMSKLFRKIYKLINNNNHLILLRCRPF